VRQRFKHATGQRSVTSISEGDIVNSQCPPDPSQTAEAAYLGHLDREANQKFHDHMAGCAGCRRVYDETVAFIDAIRKAATDLGK